MLIGVIAILHVFVAHFAVGGGLYLVLTEWRAARAGDDGLLRYLRGHSRFLILVVLVFGAVSGVGIWWTIGLVAPAATSTLLHVFVWAWAIEWVCFLVEIVAALVYYYGWDRLDRRSHLAVGWIYFVAAWLSLFVINGILTFMLTPGRWLELPLGSRSLWGAFANPTMLPSLVVRTMVAIALAGLYGLLTAAAVEAPGLRHRLTRHAAGWVLLPAVVLPAAGAWYILEIPPLARTISMGGSPPVTIFAGLSVVFSAVLFLFTFLGPFQRPQAFGLPFAVLLVLLGLATTGVTEWVREAVRKPYLIYGYMYSNGITRAEAERIGRRGALATARWASVAAVDPADRLRAGEELYRLQCASCHTREGFNSIRFAVMGWREEFIDFQLRHLDELKGFMPPFFGTEEERRALAAWLARLTPPGQAPRAPELRQPAWDLP
jgi:cytochrome bd-type quinol oxidase subunit 1